MDHIHSTDCPEHDTLDPELEQTKTSPLIHYILDLKKVIKKETILKVFRNKPIMCVLFFYSLYCINLLFGSCTDVPIFKYKSISIYRYTCQKACLYGIQYDTQTIDPELNMLQSARIELYSVLWEWSVFPRSGVISILHSSSGYENLLTRR